MSYTVSLIGLGNRLQTEAFINGARATVNYLIIVDSGLDTGHLQGDLFIGGYQDVSALKVR